MITKESVIKARVSEEMRTKLEQLADKTDKTMSQIIREALAEYLQSKEND